MNFNGTKTRVLTITLAVICTLAPLSQTMAAGRYRSRKTTGYRNLDRKKSKKSYLRHANSSSTKRTNNDKVAEVVTGVAILAIVGWLISDSFNNNNNQYNKSRHERERKRNENAWRTRRGY